MRRNRPSESSPTIKEWRSLYRHCWADFVRPDLLAYKRWQLSIKMLAQQHIKCRFPEPFASVTVSKKIFEHSIALFLPERQISLRHGVRGGPVRFTTTEKSGCSIIDGSILQVTPARGQRNEPQ
jgi:hypothetical protein